MQNGSTALQVLKSIVSLIQKILPARAFEVFYKISFPIYKKVNSLFYLLKGYIIYLIGNDKIKWNMVRQIYHVMPYSLVGVGGLEATYNIVSEICHNDIPGDIVELGVAKGGCAALMGKVIFDRNSLYKIEKKLWLFDSYEGLPEPTDLDYNNEIGDGTGTHVKPLPKGACLGQLDEVKQLMFQINDFPKDKIIFVKGWFENTVPVTKQQFQQIAVLRIDADWYESTKCCLENLYEKVSPGGYVIIDDYLTCYGCKRAVDEFIQKIAFSPQLNFDGRGGCYFKKFC